MPAENAGLSVRTTAAHTQRLWRLIPSWPRLALLAGVVVVALMLLGGSRAAGLAPDQVGQWSAPEQWPEVAVHMSLEPNGQVFVLDGFAAAPNSERLWDPVLDTFVGIPYSRNLFCAGHIQLADGRLLLVGGHISADNGLADTTIFNPSTNQYFRAPDMTVGRWYPTVTQLPDGRVFTIAGDNIVQDRTGQPHSLTDASVNSLPEVFNPRTNTWTDLDGARLTSPLYPFMFVLSDGRLFDAGPDTTTRILDPRTWQWSVVGTSPFDGMSAVMYRPNKIMKAGTWADPDFAGSQVYNAHGRTAVIDMNAATPAWRETSAMAFPRAYQNLTLLPDGKVFASGGMSTSDGVDISKAVLPAEIWDPDTETWSTVASLQNGREYHSTALLLPDGRVLMAGGGQLPGSGAVNQTNAEIYSPPYLFKGARPSISSAPSNINYGASFDINTPDAASISKISLIRLPSVTHGFDQNQRFQFLNFTTGSGKVTATAPGNANLAPPGDYMLFILNGNSVPSVASIIHVNQPTDTTPPAVSVTAPANGASVSGNVSLTANATDNTSIDNVQYKLDGANLGTKQFGAPFSLQWDSGQVANGSHAITAVATDPAGNTTTSAAVNITVNNSGGPRQNLVGAYSFDEGSGTTAHDISGNNNTGTISNATWSASGKFGSALSFNGTNSIVTIPDSSSLDLTAGMTLEAWVNPSALGSNTWRTAVFKSQPNNYAYALYANTGSAVPSGNAVTGGSDHDQRGTSALPLNTWSHLAVTYDGSTLRLYVNGTQVGSQAATGAISTSTGAVTIGGNNVWPEWFSGLIDEVRIYNVALTVPEIQQDMAASIGTPDTQPPSAPANLSASGSLSSVSLSWSASTDNVGVARYDLYRSTTP
ncbi:MAG: LamG-like jellyroll fold domain-containing protein, partial [Mycetocola sp.]